MIQYTVFKEQLEIKLAACGSDEDRAELAVSEYLAIGEGKRVVKDSPRYAAVRAYRFFMKQPDMRNPATFIARKLDDSGLIEAVEQSISYDSKRRRLINERIQLGLRVNSSDFGRELRYKLPRVNPWEEVTKRMLLETVKQYG